MAQQEFIPILDDGEILSASPLIILDTRYYELWYQINGNANWAQQIFESPLPLYTVGSPAALKPCVLITPLADGQHYNFKIRRFNSNSEASEWVTGSFTTGIS